MAVPDTGTPAISVCVPVRQGGPHLERALRSVLDQDVDGLEVVVRDNASTDGSAEVVGDLGDPRVRLERGTALVPLAENWARTVALARGELVKVLCADDELAPGALRAQAGVLHAEPSVALAVSRTDMIDDDGRVLFAGRHLPRPLLGRRSPAEVYRAVVRHGGNPIGPPAAVTFRRAHFEAIGGFRDAFRFCLDLDLWVRLLAHGGLHGDRRTGASFRIHAGSESATRTRAQFAEQRAFTRELADRPDAGIAGHDRLAGTVGAYGALARRCALFVYSGLRRPWSGRSGRSGRTGVTGRRRSSGDGAERASPPA